MPAGELNQAALPSPSRLPRLDAEPATVVTTPAGEIFRIVALPVSATYRLPAESAERPPGWLNLASLAAPSCEPTEPAEPASVVTWPAGLTLQIVLAPASAT